MKYYFNSFSGTLIMYKPLTYLAQTDSGILYTACPLKDLNGNMPLKEGLPIPAYDITITVEKTCHSSISEDELQKLRDYIQLSVGNYLVQKFGIPTGF